MNEAFFEKLGMEKEDARGFAEIRSRFYFAYGSNMSMQVLTEKIKPIVGDEVFSKIRIIGKATLLDYKLMFNKISKMDSTVGFANIVHKWGDVIEGVVYDLGEDEKVREIIFSALDKKEGYPTHYQKTTVLVLVNPIDVKKEYAANNDIYIDDNHTALIPVVTYIADVERQAPHNLTIKEEYAAEVLDGLKMLSESYSNKTKEMISIWKE